MEEGKDQEWRKGRTKNGGREGPRIEEGKGKEWKGRTKGTM